MFTHKKPTLPQLLLSFLLLVGHVPSVPAQNTVTGAFEGTVTNSDTGQPVAGATALIINQQTGQTYPKTADSRGRFYQGLLAPGIYTIRVSAPGFVTKEVQQRLFITRTGEVVPVPVALDPAPPAPAATPTPTVTPAASPLPAPQTLSAEDTDIRARVNAADASRGGAFTEEELAALPLGANTFVRTFDELALLLPGVTPPPQTLGTVAGPGVGAGVGSAGQFAVNGLRSRANNFTVDGSDNNDEDIGVRRQGFVALNSQPVESVKEYHVTTLLAPAKFGRDIGAQVNAVSKSGGDQTHGTLYGFFNASQLNARGAFDTNFGNAVTPLRSASGQPVLLDGTPLLVRNESGGEDSFTFGQAGAVLGGPVKSPNLFYFLSAEGQRINATKEESFAVPTVEQRGLFGAGASGIFRDPFTGAPVAATPGSINGSALFGLYPFPNNPQGVYGVNTFTEVLPAGARGRIFSAKLDDNFKLGGRAQSITNRYNYTDDRRAIPATGGALFATLRPRVRTQNNSLFFHSELSAPNAARAVFNQLRLSYGRTRLAFDELRDPRLVPSVRAPGVPFLLNAREILNVTSPPQAGVPNTGAVLLTRVPNMTVEDELGPLGQVFVAGFSPLGVDVYNFPQQRVNNTYQVADELTVSAGAHHFAFGVDWRRSELNSNLPRNSRPLVTFNGGPRLIFENGTFRPPNASDPNPFIRPEDLVALSAASNFYLTLNTAGNDARNSLRYYQYNFYAQDDWRVRRNLSVSVGLRYEYNTPVRELNGRIEQTFNSPALALAPGLSTFIAGRTSIFDPDRNNFAPRVGVAYVVNPLNQRYATIVRGGYGLFYDQILGAVVSQSRNVFPTFVTLNFGGLAASQNENFLTFFNPGRTAIFDPARGVVPIAAPGTLNQLNPALPLSELLGLIRQLFPSSLGATLPQRRLATPFAQHYTLTVEQQLGVNMTVSAAYVGTQGRNLLRFTTPNLGPGTTVVPTGFRVFSGEPVFLGRALAPPRPVATLGAINQFETTATSRYDALQLQVRGRFRRGLSYQLAYTFAKATDDVSDVFDLAGAAALPQDSFNLAAERGPANFDVRQRFAYYFVYDLPDMNARGKLARALFGNLQLAGMGSYQTGQPFTVNSIFDINLDGNLTDRLNTTTGLITTGNRRQPLQLTVAPTTLLAPIGRDGQIGRNTFRAGNVLDLNLSISKRIKLSTRQSLLFRTDLFNFINRANYGIPVRQLEAPGFGQATNTVTPGRRVQFALKYSF